MGDDIVVGGRRHRGPRFRSHRTALHEISRKLRALGALPDSMSDDDFADITLYHYGPQNGFHFTVSVLGWPEQRARDFISAQYAHSLSAPSPGPRQSV